MLNDEIVVKLDTPNKMKQQGKVLLMSYQIPPAILGAGSKNNQRDNDSRMGVLSTLSGSRATPLNESVAFKNLDTLENSQAAML